MRRELIVRPDGLHCRAPRQKPENFLTRISRINANSNKLKYAEGVTEISLGLERSDYAFSVFSQGCAAMQPYQTEIISR